MRAEKREVGKVENVPLSMQVADILRQAIIDGQMKPGMQLVEMALAEQLEVSRAPVREAIQILERDGLVETMAYRGKRVRPLTPKDVEELYSLRELFEQFAISRIIATGTDISILTRHCESMLAAAQAGDFAALVDADQAFHRSLIELANHDLLLQQWQSLYLRIRQIMALRNARNHDLVQVARNHDPIVAALLAKDLDAAQAEIAKHIRSMAEIEFAPGILGE